MNISVVYPAYNEEKNIRSTIVRSLDALRGRFHKFEIIIVNDGSIDQTGDIAEELARQNPNVRVVHNPHNMGIAITVWRGLKEARYEYVVHNGMDYCFDLNDLEKMTPLLDEADIVVASRIGRPGYTAVRKFASMFNSFLLRTLFKLKLRDYNFIQLYRKEVLDRVDLEPRHPAFLIPETLMRAYDMGYRIKEVPIEYHAREHGKALVANPKLLLSGFFNVVGFWLKWRLGDK